MHSRKIEIFRFFAGWLERNLSLFLNYFYFKYNISALLKLCVNYFANNLTEANAVDVMNSAYETNEKELFEKACKFVLKHEVIGVEDWKDMMKKNPSYVIEILEAK